VFHLGAFLSGSLLFMCSCNCIHEQITDWLADWLITSVSDYEHWDWYLWLLCTMIRSCSRLAVHVVATIRQLSSVSCPATAMHNWELLSASTRTWRVTLSSSHLANWCLTLRTCSWEYKHSVGSTAPTAPTAPLWWNSDTYEKLISLQCVRATESYPKPHKSFLLR